MNFKDLKSLLSDCDGVRVQVYCDYILRLETDAYRNGQLKNPWCASFKESTAASLFKKVAIDNLFIDGDSITLQYIQGNVQPNYNYQAYKNKLLNVYPGTKFDLQVVCESDSISITKQDGLISYKHEIIDAFASTKKIIGAYCIIKNEKGDFIETINLEEIEKIRSTAKTDNIWKTWYSEMVLKSVLKRACKRHFKDIVLNMDSIDKENSDVSEELLSFEVKHEIERCSNLLELKKVHETFGDEYSENLTFNRLLSEKKVEIQESSDFKQTVGENGLKRAIEAIKTGRLEKEAFLDKHILDENQLLDLENQLKDA